MAYSFFFLQWIEDFFFYKFFVSMTILTIMLYYFLFTFEEYRELWYSLKHNITYHERMNWRENQVFLNSKGQFINPFDRGFTKNLEEFFTSSWLYCWVDKSKKLTIGQIVRHEA